jgi:hypothetical protein
MYSYYAVAGNIKPPSEFFKDNFTSPPLEVKSTPRNTSWTQLANPREVGMRASAVGV